jgi:hypothetical protein
VLSPCLPERHDSDDVCINCDVGHGQFIFCHVRGSLTPLLLNRSDRKTAGFPGPRFANPGRFRTGTILSQNGRP